MNRLSRAERATIIRALVEGNSIRSVARMTGNARNTITTLLVQLGTACAAYQDRTLRNLGSTRIERRSRLDTSCSWFDTGRVVSTETDGSLSSGRWNSTDCWSYSSARASDSLLPILARS